MKELAYDLIIEFLKTEDEADAAYYIRGVNDMLKVAEAECDNDCECDDESETEHEEPESEEESEGESDDGSYGCEAVDVDAGESEDGPEYETTTRVTKQGVRVKTSNIDLGYLASLRSKGMTYKQIGERLGIAQSTVCTLYKKYLSQFE